MSDPIDGLNEAIEIAKAKGLIRGGSAKMARRIGRQMRSAGMGDPKFGKRFSAISTLDNRKKGRALGLGYKEGKGYAYFVRQGKYK